MKRSLILTAMLAATYGAVVSGANAAGPRFTSIHTALEGSITITLAGAPLTTYTILATTDLGMPFEAVGVVMTDATGAGSFTDVATQVLNRQRFYRAQQTVTVNSTPIRASGSVPPAQALPAKQPSRTVVATAAGK